MGNRFHPSFKIAHSHQDPICHSATYFYIGKQESSASGFIDSSDTKLLQQHLTRTRHGLKGLYLSHYKASPIPGKYILFGVSSFLLTFVYQNSTSAGTLSFDYFGSICVLTMKKAEKCKTIRSEVSICVLRMTKAEKCKTIKFEVSIRSARVSHPAPLSLKCTGCPRRGICVAGYRIRS